MSARLLTFALVLLCLPAWAGPSVLLMPVLGTEDVITLQGRALKEAREAAEHAAAAGLADRACVARAFATPASGSEARAP